MEESETGRQPGEGEQLRESVDEDEAPAADGRSSAESVARELKDKEEQTEEPSDG